jgi:hypothetical protein
MREAAVKGKILMPALQDTLDGAYIDAQISEGKTNELIDLIRRNVELPLAYFLIVAEKYSYFKYQPNQDLARPEYIYDPTDYVPELTRPLGVPMGPPVKNGYVYTRSFEHVDVRLNVETDEATLAWDSVDSDEDGLPDMWESRNFGGVTNAAALADPDGDGINNLVEFALGGDPNAKNNNGLLPTLRKIPDETFQGIEYLYRRRRDAAARGLTYTVETKTNLLSAGWNTNGIIEIGAGIIDTDFEVVTNGVPISNVGFVRLLIEWQP